MEGRKHQRSLFQMRNASRGLAFRIFCAWCVDIVRTRKRKAVKSKRDFAKNIVSSSWHVYEGM